MDITTYTEARERLKGVMDRAIHDRTETIVTRRKGEAVVIVSLDEWNAVQETLHLLSTPANAARLRSAVAQLDEGKGTPRKLIE